MVLGMSSVTPAQWQQLGQQVGGRLYAGSPFSSPCFANGTSPACTFVEAGYTDERMFSLYAHSNTPLIANSDTRERVWSLYQYAMGDLSGDWSTMSP